VTDKIKQQLESIETDKSFDEVMEYFMERAGIIEYDGCLDRNTANKLAMRETIKKYGDAK
jgi:hypothetical protein